MTKSTTDKDPSPREPRPSLGPLTDSPWFWAYLFATAALVALVLADPKYRRRQPQIERQFVARQIGGQATQGRDGPVRPSTAEDMIVSLRPLYGLVGVLLVIAWTGLWFQRFRYGRSKGAGHARGIGHARGTTRGSPRDDSGATGGHGLGR